MGEIGIILQKICTSLLQPLFSDQASHFSGYGVYQDLEANIARIASGILLFNPGTVLCQIEENVDPEWR